MLHAAALILRVTEETMKSALARAAVLLLAPSIWLLLGETPRAQLAAPGGASVSMSEWHLNARDLDANRTFWTALGGTPAERMGTSEVFSFPGVLVVLTPAAPSGPTVGSVVNHVGFQVPSVDAAVTKWKAMGMAIEPGNPNVAQVYLTSPDGVRVEILEDKAMTVPIRHHHVHWNVPQPSIPEIQSWYVRTFGAKAGMRGAFQAADIPGANLTFGQAATDVVGTRGRALDHIGFEVPNLEAFCKTLEAQGVKLDKPYTRTSGVGSALLTDPWGTHIELTEGLANWPTRK
jgi:catechol 2,3-dioxygenase-like lactoylglutathione lyase family enzyme